MKNKTPKILLLSCAVVVCAFSLSCNKADESKLTISSSSSVFLIPATTPSCASQYTAESSSSAPNRDIASKYFTLTNLYLNWGDATKTAQIAGIKVTIQSPYVKNGEKYECIIGADELAALFAEKRNTISGGNVTATQKVLWNTMIDPLQRVPNTSAATATSSVERYCGGLKCGGIETAEGKVFTATALVEVFGSAVDPANGEESPIRAQSTFEIQNAF